MNVKAVEWVISSLLFMLILIVTTDRDVAFADSTSTTPQTSAQRCRAEAALPENGGVEFDKLLPETAIKTCLAASRDQPSPDTQAFLCRAYQKAGQTKTAARLCRRAAKTGSAEGMANYGNLLRDGQGGVKRNEREAAMWYRRAAEHGLADAQNNLGLMLEDGRGIRQNATEAMEWYQRAAERGLAEAQTNFGSMLEKGKGDEATVDAAKWYLRVAAQGNNDGAAHFAWLLIGRQIANFDIRPEAELLESRAEKGDDLSAILLQMLIILGKGERQDIDRAVRRLTEIVSAKPAVLNSGLLPALIALFDRASLSTVGLDIATKVLAGLPSELNEKLYSSVSFYLANECHAGARSSAALPYLDKLGRSGVAGAYTAKGYINLFQNQYLSKSKSAFSGWLETSDSFESAAEMGEPNAQVLMWEHFWKNSFAFFWLVAAAESGNVVAQWRLGVAYLDGKPRRCGSCSLSF
jgi:TPR repeat protein